MNILKYIGKGNVHFDRDMSFQDYASFSKKKNSNTVLALSDGCGSYGISELGSKANVDAVIDYFCMSGKGKLSEMYKASDKTKAEILDSVREELFRVADNQKINSIEGLAGTLLFAVINKKCGGILTGHIGDGYIICFTDDGVPSVISEPDNGTRKNETYYANSSDSPEHFRLNYIDCEKISHVFLFSDGVEPYLYAKGNGNAVAGAAELLKAIKDNKITTCAMLSDYLHKDFSYSVGNINDDWSLLIADFTQKEQCNDVSNTPYIMTYHFFEYFFAEHPEGRQYAEKEIQKASEQYKKISEYLPENKKRR